MVGMTEHNESDDLRQLILRGESILERIQTVEGTNFFAAIVRYLGPVVVAHVNTPKWKDTTSEVVAAGLEALTGPAKKLHEDYTEWYTDCKIIFSKKGWNRSRRVKIFDEIPNLVSLDSIAARVRMIVERQIEILKDLVNVSPRGTLEELEKSKDEEVAMLANELRAVVIDNSPQLMIAEQNGLKQHGIETREYFVYLTYSENTGRLSTLWHYETRTIRDTMRVALKCSPDDIRKRSKVERWVESRPDLKEKVEHETEGE